MLKEPSGPERHDDPHLRSTKHVTGYHIHAIDGEIGHVADFIIDEENWTISNLIVDTGNWLPGRKVLIPPAWIKSINWDETSVYIDRTREAVKNSPEWEAKARVQSAFDHIRDLKS
jgi:sporulation protein YlmC with PRC-barrel domain